MANGLRTVVYIDGFNFYYGQVKGSPYKWLNPEALFQNLLPTHNSLIKIKYFTAKVHPSPHDPKVHLRQENYLQAISACCPLTELHYGHFLRHRVFIENANPPPAKIEVWKTEEKGSDVNMALHILNDAWQDLYDCAVIVSNDSDLSEALQLVKSQHNKIIGVVTPGAPKRKTSYQLRKYADFVKPIRTWMLKKSLLPDNIPGTKLRKPPSW